MFSKVLRTSIVWQVIKELSSKWKISNGLIEHCKNSVSCWWKRTVTVINNQSTVFSRDLICSVLYAVLRNFSCYKNSKAMTSKSKPVSWSLQLKHVEATVHLIISLRTFTRYLQYLMWEVVAKITSVAILQNRNANTLTRDS